MSVAIDDIRQTIAEGAALSPAQAQVLLAAYDDVSLALERLRTRVGDLEFHYEVFEHLMTDRKVMMEKFAALGLEITSEPTSDRQSWRWVWRWHNEEHSNKGFERSIHALIDAIETLLSERDEALATGMSDESYGT